MAAPSAVFLALDLVRSPILAGVMRQHPLPSDVLFLIRIAAGSKEALEKAEDLTGKSRAQLRTAAVFDIQQVMWPRGGDCYRVLGASPEAAQPELVEHLRWLMKWLHPDRGKSELNKLYAGRVLGAWDQLKTPDRRQTYDRSLRTTKRTRSPQLRRKLVKAALPLLPRVESLAGGKKARLWFSGPQLLVLAGLTLTAATLALLTKLPQ